MLELNFQRFLINSFKKSMSQGIINLERSTDNPIAFFLVNYHIDSYYS